MLPPNQAPPGAIQLGNTDAKQSPKQSPNTDSNKAIQNYFCDTVDFSLSFKWDTDTKSSSTPNFFSTIVSYMSKPIRPAIQILFNSAKVSQLLSEYDHMVMQSKSPNVLVANYSWLKLNGLFTVLLAAGIQFNELDQRRRDIIKKAIEENKAKFEENEYSLELFEIVSNTKSKKNRKLIRSLIKIRQELSVHMEKLGQPNWYTPARQTNIQLDQLTRIHSNFTDEHTQIDYQLMYWHTPDATTGIQVRISDFDHDTHHELEKKKAKLSIYFNKINTRKRILHGQLHQHLHANRISDTEARHHQDVLGLKPLGVIQ